MGLIWILDDECNFPGGTDASFLGKVFKFHESNMALFKPMAKRASFGVKHYAGNVVYEVDGFLDKNRETIRSELSELMQSTTDALFSVWFDEASATGKSGFSSGTLRNLVPPKRESFTTLPAAVASPSPGRKPKSATTGAQFHVHHHRRRCLLVEFAVGADSDIVGMQSILCSLHQTQYPKSRGPD